MKKSRFSNSAIMAILKQAEAGSTVPDLCREHGMSSAAFYKWRTKFGGMDVSRMSRMKELEEENRRLKKMYVDAQMQADVLKEAPTPAVNAIANAPQNVTRMIPFIKGAPPVRAATPSRSAKNTSEVVETSGIRLAVQHKGSGLP